MGQFNAVVADYAIKILAALPGKCHVWAVGERVHARLADAGLPLVGFFTVPNSVQAIIPLVGQIQIESEAHRDKGENTPLWVFNNRPLSGALYEPVSQRLCRSIRNGNKVWPKSTGRLPTCPRSRAAALQLCARLSANIFSSRSSGPAPNPWPARTRAD